MKTLTLTRKLFLNDFDFWREAKNHNFTHNELKELDFILGDLYPDGIEETTVNDLFWFQEEFLCECIGIDYENDYLNR